MVPFGSSPVSSGPFMGISDILFLDSVRRPVTRRRGGPDPEIRPAAAVGGVMLSSVSTTIIIT
jgi:hypothetical protein